MHHRALNTQKAFEEFVSLSEKSEQTLAGEGDICWAYIDGTYVIYIHHPDVQGKSLSDEKIKELLAKEKLFTLEKLFTINSSVNFILELKTGTGEIEGFFKEFKNILEKFDVRSVIVDAFSVAQLRGLKTYIPDIQTSMHTKFVFGKYVLESTFEKPYLKLHKLYDLDCIDYITLSYTTTHVNLLSLDIDKSFREVFLSNKQLNLGSIKSLDALKKAVYSKAEYIYLRSDVVRKNYSNLKL